MDPLTEKMVRLYRETSLSKPKIAEKLGVTTPTVSGRLVRFFKRHPELKQRGGQSGSNLAGKKGPVKGEPIELVAAMSEHDFLKPFDWAGRLEEGIRKLTTESKSAVIRDDDFRKSLKIPQDKWRRLKRMGGYKEYQLVIHGSTYWCQKETKSRLKAKIELAEEVL